MLATLTLALAACAPQFEQLLQPTDHASHSGEWVLHVDPSHRDGRGPGEYRMSRNGEEVWQRTLPVSLWDAVVSDEGRVVGCAYAGGFDVDGEDSSFHVVVIDAVGDVVTNDATPRGSSYAPHQSGGPHVRDVVMQEDLDRVLIRIDDRGDSSAWWTYGLSDGLRREDWSVPPPRDVPWEKKEACVLHPQSVAALPGTPLLLVHWSYWNGGRSDGVPNRGVLYSLVDGTDETVWMETRPLEHIVPGDEQASDSLWSNNVHRNPILSTTSPGRFSLWNPKDRERADYVARPEGEEWVVELVTQTPFEFGTESPRGSTETKSVDLEHIASVRLRPAEHAVGEALGRITRTAKRADGGVDALRYAPDGLELVHVSSSGEVVDVRTVADDEAQDRDRWHAGPDGTWYVVHPLDEDDSVEVSLRNAWTGESRSIATLPVTEIERIVSAPDGGIVLLGRRGRGRFGTERILLVGSDGKVHLHGQVDDEDIEAEDALLSPDDVAVTTTGELVAVDAVREAMQVFDPNGRFLRSIDLEAVLGDDSYPSLVVADDAGGVWVGGSTKLWHLTLEGSVLAHFAPRLANGLPLDEYTLVVDESGTLWFHGTDMIASVSPDGTPGPVLGRAPSGTVLTTPDGAWIDRMGRILVHDDRSGSWHAFDAQGEELFACVLPPGVESESFNRPSTDEDGVVHVPVETAAGDVLHIAFGANGERIGEEDFASRLIVFGRDDAVWRVGGYGRSLDRLDGEGTLVERLERQPDRRWWKYLSQLHIAADDSRILAVTRDASGDAALAVYDGDGRNARTIALPPDAGVATSISTAWAAGPARSGALLVRLDDGRCSLFEFETEGSNEWGFSPDGSELWCVDVDAMTLHRFALPSD